MPILLREAGYRFGIYTDDHPPAHVHVFSRGNEAVIVVEDELSVRNNWGMRTDELRTILRIVNRNREMFLNEWRRIYG